MGITLGLHVGPQECSYEELRRIWRMAEAGGMGWISVWDHHYETPPRDGSGTVYETVAALTALALETQRVRIGCLVFCPLYRNPALLAKVAVTVDQMSDGRMEMGLGACWHEMESRAFGYEFPPIGVREDMLEEAIQIVRGMLEQGEVTFEGRYFRVEKAKCFPRPVRGRIPIWVGGGGERRTLRTAARYADGWNVGYVSPEIFRRKADVVRRWCEQDGRDPTQLRNSVNVGFYMGVTETEARRKVEVAQRDFGAMFEPFREGLLLGTPTEVAERIRQYAEAGAEQVNVVLRAPFDWEAFEAFLQEVVPIVQHA
jgi:F420-dependent oxidoreductase-like protein